MISSKLNSPFKVGLLAAIILCSLITGRWWFGGCDISRFMVCGDHFTNSAKTPISLQVIKHCGGYDGQFFSRLAFAPFTRERHAYGMTLDSPSYRQQRIFYPFMAWVLAAGRAELVPWTLVIINLFALIGIAFLAASMAKRFHLHPAYGLLPMLSCGLILSFGRNLAEPLAAFLVTLTLYLLFEKKMFLCVLAASLSVLTRESSLITFAAIGILLMSFSLHDKHQPKDKSFLLFLLPLMVYTIWQIYLKVVWGSLPLTSGPSLSPYPLRDFILQLRLNPYRQKPFECLVSFLYLTWYFWLALEVLGSFRIKLKNPKTEKFCFIVTLHTAWLFWSIFILFLPLCMWVDDWSFTRVMAEWSLLGWLCLFACSKRPGKGLVFFTLILAAGSILRLWLRP